MCSSVPINALHGVHVAAKVIMRLLVQGNKVLAEKPMSSSCNARAIANGRGESVTKLASKASGLCRLRGSKTVGQCII